MDHNFKLIIPMVIMRCFLHAVPVAISLAPPPIVLDILRTSMVDSPLISNADILMMKTMGLREIITLMRQSQKE